MIRVARDETARSVRGMTRGDRSGHHGGDGVRRTVQRFEDLRTGPIADGALRAADGGPYQR